MTKPFQMLAAVALVIYVCGCKKQVYQITPGSYEYGSSGQSFAIVYSDTLNNRFLSALRNHNNLSLLAGGGSDLDKVVAITNWVNSRWKHNGSNSPNGKNAAEILQGASQGGQYSCVGYGVVLAGCLNSIGLKSRVIGLKTKDVETAQCCAGHVCTEVFLNDLKKWVLCDAQFNVVPILDNKPLNAFELREGIQSSYKSLVLKGAENNKSDYLNFVGKYLYFFDINMDNSDNGTHTNSKSLFLSPTGVAAPTRFQKSGTINQMGILTTHHVADFYQRP